jgi:hypothetical protein
VIVETAYRPTARPNATDPVANDAGKRLELSSGRVRPAVLKAARALREMPPFAREREIDFGRYSNLSPKERELLRNLDQ